MPEDKTVDWVVQQRVRGGVGLPWPRWGNTTPVKDQPAGEACVARNRARVKKDGWEGREEWRLLKVTQEVVF